MSACNCIGTQNGQPRCPCMMGRRSTDGRSRSFYSNRINPVGAKNALYGTREEGVNERLSRWEMAIESILVEMARETDGKGLFLYVDVDPVVCEVDKIIKEIRNLHRLRKENPQHNYNDTRQPT